ncbi:MAG: efflux transporter outer membrane subunit [Janthinobacterium lividum]
MMRRQSIGASAAIRRYLENCGGATGTAGTTDIPGTRRLSALARAALGVVGVFALTACTVGPNFEKPSVAIPATFKEGADWQHSAANPDGALSSQWWLAFHDDILTGLVNQSLKANQSIISAEAAYREALAVVSANTASLFPTVTADMSASRSSSSNSSGLNSVNTTNGTTTTGIRNSVSATATASWEPDLWGEVRREIESAKQAAQSSDAQLAGERLSIAASVATDYFELRTLDLDIASDEQQQAVDNKLLAMTQAGYQQGTESNDAILLAQDTLETVVADLQTSKISREQYEHALAVLTGVPPSSLSIPAQPAYVFATPTIPLSVPSVLLERRPDVIAAERTAAAANARIGVAEAAFFPTLDLSAEGGFQHNTLANLFSLPNRLWTLGPDLAATIFDGGARSAAVAEARATYDEEAAAYRLAVLTAFQNVEDSLSSVNHLQTEASAFQNIYQRNQQLFSSEQAQLNAGTASQQSVLTQQLLLLTAEQSVRDAQGLLAQNAVALIKNLGGGWQWNQQTQSAVAVAAPAALAAKP